MTTLTVNIPDSATNKFNKFLQNLGGEVVEVISKETPLSRLEEGLCEVKAIKEGKIKGFTLAEIIGK